MGLAPWGSHGASPMAIARGSIVLANTQPGLPCAREVWGAAEGGGEEEPAVQAAGWGEGVVLDTSRFRIH